MKRRAFTLIELLITTSIFVVVSIIATSVFTVTARFQSVTKQNQQNTTQARIAASVLKDAIERTVEYGVQPKLLTADGQSASSTAFVTKASPRLSDGRIDPITTNEKWEYYCVETSATGAKRLVRFMATALGGSSPMSCSSQAFSTSGAAGVTGPEYITSEQVDVSWMLIRQLGTAGAALSYGQNAAYDIEVATVYDPTNTGAERRASDTLTAVGQVVVHTIASHYDVQNELINQF